MAAVLSTVYQVFVGEQDFPVPEGCTHPPRELMNGNQVVVFKIDRHGMTQITFEEFIHRVWSTHAGVSR